MENTVSEIVKRVYNEIGLPEPQLQSYSLLDDFVADYVNWKNEASPIIANHWSYQYPILNPYCFWARYRLYDEGFQFDLTRKPNEHGCYIYPVYSSKIDIKPGILYGRYIAAAIDGVVNNSKNDLDNKIANFRSAHEGFFEKMQDELYAEDPATPASVAEYMFLGGFSWLMIEKYILRDMRKWIRKPVCQEHYQNVKSICDSGILLVTFRKIVFWIQNL